MQNLRINSFQQVQSFYLIVIFSVLLGLSACENPGSVGSDLTEPGSDVVRDTLIINDVRAVNAPSYSGELDYFSAGSFEDQLFGTLNATGYLKPNLPESSDTLRDDGEVFLRVMYDMGQTYGDTVATQDFDLYRVDQYWRDRALKIDDELDLEDQRIGEFSVDNEDSLMINLSEIAPDWVEDYREFSRDSKEDTTGQTDSTYTYEENGLAFFAQNNEKIIPLSRESTQIVAINPENDTAEADTFDVNLNRWGYYLDRADDGSIPEGSLPLHSTFESVINFKELGISQLDLQPPGLSRAELIFYENTSALEQSLNGEPGTTKRAKDQTAYLHLAHPDEVPENIDPGAPQNSPTRVQGSYSEDDGTYRFDVTSLVENILRNGVPEEREFFITLPNDGVVKSTVLMSDSDQVPNSLKPKIIITSLKNSRD